MSNNRFVYLAGPIAGCNDAEANNWRDDVQQALHDNIIGISPLRCEPLVGEVYDATDDPLSTSPGAISAKNMFDTKECDLVLAYMPKDLNARRPSYGTAMEIGWAIMLQKPLIVITDDPILINHPLIKHNAGWLLDNLDDAVHVINNLFTDYVNTCDDIITTHPGMYTTITKPT